MKKLLLKINLLNFILTIPTLALFNNYNQRFSENYMEQQTADSFFTWTNGSYRFANMQRHLYVRKENTNNYLKISDFEGTVNKGYFSDNNNDVLFTTDKGLILIREGFSKLFKN